MNQTETVTLKVEPLTRYAVTYSRTLGIYAKDEDEAMSIAWTWDEGGNRDFAVKDFGADIEAIEVMS